MTSNEEKLNQLIDEVSNFEDIKIQDIPCIDLYMDQVTTFFDDKLGNLKRSQDDAILTKTMINNYTKGKVLMPPKKKKYSKEHIILLNLIYNLKQTLSLNDIKSILAPMSQPMGSDSSLSIDAVYDTFLHIKEQELTSFSKDIEERLEQIRELTPESRDDNQDLKRLVLIVLMLINGANLQKRLAEKMIDAFFKA